MTATLEQHSTSTQSALEQMSIVIVGHVDHGKSTVLGRLMADTNSLPDGKLEQVKATCKANARPFEYAFLLDALKNEQAQGITIDAARCFFKSDKRHYIIIDAPGHIEFLKNMITGASRAEAACLVIDANEGIKENSKRHGYMVSMLGIKQVAILVNKMDLVDYDEETFNKISQEYTEFLAELNVKPSCFIPISAFEGENIVSTSEKMPWYDGRSVLEQVDAFTKAEAPTELPFRFPVQDIYKFTMDNDDRRIVAGTVNTGTASVGDKVRFLPSGKTSTIKSIEMFNAPQKTQAEPEQAIGFTLDTQIYIQRGELMVREDDPQPEVSTRFRTNLFWMGHAPMIKGKTYKLKVGASRHMVTLAEIVHVLDASELSSSQNKQQVDRHDVAECILESNKPIAFDVVSEIEHTGRFVIVDNYEIAGAGIIQESISDDKSVLRDHIVRREETWSPSDIPASERAAAYRHGAKFIMIAGDESDYKLSLGKALEKKLFYKNFKSYYLAMRSLVTGLDSDIQVSGDRSEHIRRLGELARIMTDSGQIFISTAASLDQFDIHILKQLNEPNEILVVNASGDDMNDDLIDVVVEPGADLDAATTEVYDILKKKQIVDYIL